MTYIPLFLVEMFLLEREIIVLLSAQAQTLQGTCVHVQLFVLKFTQSNE